MFITIKPIYFQAQNTPLYRHFWVLETETGAKVLIFGV
jgi:hypothetical protein